MTKSLKYKTKNFLILLIWFSGLAALRKKILLKRRKNLFRVLCFHWIGSENKEHFEKIVKKINSQYQIVKLSELFYSKSKNPKQSNDLKVCITFDDGFSDFKKIVLPIITKYKIPVTLFIPSEILLLDQNERRCFAKNNIGIDRDLLSPNEVSELSQNELIDLQSHSVTHCDFGRKNIEFLKNELIKSKIKIEQISKKEVCFLAFPFGDIFNICRRPHELLKKCEYKAAFTIVPGFNHESKNEFKLHRDSINPDENLQVLIARIEGSYDYLKFSINQIRKFKSSIFKK